MPTLNFLRRIFFGFIWYLILVNGMGFLLTFFIAIPLKMMGNDYGGQMALEAYANNKHWMIVVAIGLALFGTIKAVLPGTKETWNYRELVIGKIRISAVMAGFATYFLASLFSSLAIGFLWVTQVRQVKAQDLEDYAINGDPGFLIVCLVIGGFFSIIGGYVAGKIAKDYPV
jgi:hypothetical protein